METEREIFSLKELLEANISTYKVLADLKHYQFNVQLTETKVRGNKTYLLKAIKNLIDNAFHYTVEGGEILVRLEDGVLIVENEAERVLDESQIQQIFQFILRIPRGGSEVFFKKVAKILASGADNLPGNITPPGYFLP